MLLRMAVYNYAAQYMYEKEVISIVIYIGEKELTMQNVLLTNNNYYSFKLIDIRDIDPELFLKSKNSKEVILVLAGKDKRREN